MLFKNFVAIWKETGRQSALLEKIRMKSFSVINKFDFYIGQKILRIRKTDLCPFFLFFLPYTFIHDHKKIVADVATTSLLSDLIWCCQS